MKHHVHFIWYCVRHFGLRCYIPRASSTVLCTVCPFFLYCALHLGTRCLVHNLYKELASKPVLTAQTTTIYEPVLCATFLTAVFEQTTGRPLRPFEAFVFLTAVSAVVCGRSGRDAQLWMFGSPVSMLPMHPQSSHTNACLASVYGVVITLLPLKTTLFMLFHTHSFILILLLLVCISCNSWFALEHTETRMCEPAFTHVLCSYSSRTLCLCSCGQVFSFMQCATVVPVTCIYFSF